MDDLAQYSLLFILKNSESLVIHNVLLSASLQYVAGNRNITMVYTYN